MTRTLVLGPVLRFLGPTEATVWVETDGACEVSVLGSSSRTFQIEGHHYGLVAVRGLEPGSPYAYTVALDGDVVWPEASALAASVIRPLQPDTVDIVFGSCRVAAGHGPPFTLSPGQHKSGHGHDALRALALKLARSEPATWPQALLLLGDQIYADEVSPGTRAFVESRRGAPSVHDDEVRDFDEYCSLYQESWQDPPVRWLLSTVGSLMVWDDHEVHDDWNISRPWVERMQGELWWRERFIGAFMAYWVYQLLGNMSPDELDGDDLLAGVRAAEDGGPLLREFATVVLADPQKMRWSFRRDFGPVRLLTVDCRSTRVLERGAYSMIAPTEWSWLDEQMRGDFTHLLLGLPDPYLLSPAIHRLEAVNDAIEAGTWGRRLAAVGERFREGLDFDHWAAFGRSFEQLTELIRGVAAGERGTPPASIIALSGDVHNCYVSRVTFPTAAGAHSLVYQAVCSPFRNPLGPWQRRVLRLTDSLPARLFTRALAAAARVPPPSISWRNVAGPWFDNQIGTLELRGRQATLRIERAVGERDGSGARLECLFERRLA